MGESEYLVKRNGVTICHTPDRGFALIIQSTMTREEGNLKRGDEEPFLREWIFDQIDTRDTIFRSCYTDSRDDRFIGYLLALYDTGYISWNDVRKLEKKYKVVVFDAD